MEAQTPSRTAMATSLMRALHSHADPLPFIDDPWGERLLTDARAVIDERARKAGLTGVDEYLHGNAAYLNVILRTRFAEDALAESLARGVRQYVVIGAGFDSYALRNGASDLVVYEVDHPATQTYKRRLLADSGVATPANLRFVAADLGEEKLGDALARADFDASAPAFFSWLGVTMYLPREANFATFREIARLGAAGDELAFNYMDARVLAAVNAPAFAAMRAQVESAGEPFVCGFDPARIGADLAECGLTLLEDHGGDELLARYDPERRNGFVGKPTSRVARARIG